MTCPTRLFGPWNKIVALPQPGEEPDDGAKSGSLDAGAPSKNYASLSRQSKPAPEFGFQASPSGFEPLFADVF
jgi:hypothetical protein